MCCWWSVGGLAVEVAAVRQRRCGEERRVRHWARVCGVAGAAHDRVETRQQTMALLK